MLKNGALTTSTLSLSVAFDSLVKELVTDEDLD